MNVLFLTISNINDLQGTGIYSDLMKKIRNEGHQLYIVSPAERKTGQLTHIIDTDGVKILKVRTLNIQKTNVVEKGLGTLLIEQQFKAAIKKHLKDVKFDLILYSTPPITFTNVVRFLKKKNPNAVSYLLLKDIFPQNAVDLGMLVASPKPSSQGKGLKNTVIALPKYLLYKYFRKKEVALYKNSDYIGCMSPANVEYLKKHNSYYPADHVEVAPNSIDLLCKQSEQARVNLDLNLDTDQRRLKVLNERYYIRKKYNLPTDVPIFIYGGNLGKPQGIDYLIKCLDANKHRTDCFFVVVGNGTEYKKIEEWAYNNKNSCVKLMSRLSADDYEMLVKYCDVGLIFLDHRFTIPNYPSRLLSYLENKMPVICATDVNTDIGKIAEENGYGYWCESVNPEDFTALVDKMLKSDRKVMGEKGYQFLIENYLVEHTYNTIIKHLE